MINHNRLYSFILVIAAALTTISIGLLLYLSGLSANANLALRVPDWTLPWWAALHSFYLIAIIVTLWSRKLNARLGRRLTRILNLLLLPALPFGTILGIYGLWKVDRTMPVVEEPLAERRHVGSSSHG